MTHHVVVTDGAARDLAAIHHWIDREAGQATADAFLEALTVRIDGLEHFPMRGAIAPELERVGIGTVRQVPVDPYRLFYEIDGDRIIVIAVVHARRDLRTALEQRLLGTD